jgi:hypothetical protein
VYNIKDSWAIVSFAVSVHFFVHGNIFNYLGTISLKKCQAKEGANWPDVIKDEMRNTRELWYFCDTHKEEP